LKFFQQQEEFFLVRNKSIFSCMHTNCICGLRAFAYPLWRLRLLESDLSYRFGRILIFFALAVLPMSAQRLPVLKQIDLPYSLYYREMYLPQLTSGPSSVAWMPDSQSVIFSMQGSLWRQGLGSTTAEQLTSGPGYDYQPDVSSDGKWVIYSKYDHDAIELWLLDLTTQKSKQLTKTDAVNVEPRWSPAFKSGDMRVMFVSTQLNRHFHVFVAQFDPAKAELKEVQRLTAEARSTLPRVFYGIFDHEISPTWSPDGKEIIFVSNHNRVDGAGGFWRMKSQPVLVEAPPMVPHGPFGMMARRLPPIVKEESHQIHDEETTWRARPDWSPDGKRVAYASYSGSLASGKHQLQVMTSEGRDTAPLSQSQGEYDDTNPRWSPDGKSIAFISNRGGNLSLWVQDASEGSQHEIARKDLKFLATMATIRLQGGEVSGAAGPVRVSITGADGRDYATDDALVYTDDGFDRKERPFEVHYFDLSVSRLRPSQAITLPPGKIHVEITHGLEHVPVSLDVDLKAGESKTIPFKLQALRLRDPLGSRWMDGDVHVSTKYGGAYRSTPLTLLTQMQAEDLSLAYSLMTSNDEQHSPDATTAGVASKADPNFDLKTGPGVRTTHHVLNGIEFQSNYLGNLGLLSAYPSSSRRYAAYPNAARTGFFPTNADIVDWFHQTNRLVGYAQNFSEVPNPVNDEKLSYELPIDVALGKVDYYEVLDSGDHKSSAEIWYKLLNLGFRLPAAAGSSAIANYSSLRGPVGLDRVYVRVPSGPFKTNAWLDGLKHGRSFATNGPLLRFTLGTEAVGGELKLPAPGRVKFTVALRSIVPVDHLEVVCNGEVMINVPMNQTHNASDAIGALQLPRSGWCLLRAWAEKTEDPVLDSYPYATTSPIYVTVAGAKPRSPNDAAYFMAWIDRVAENAKANSEYKNEAQKTGVLKTIQDARAVYEKLAR